MEWESTSTNTSGLRRRHQNQNGAFTNGNGSSSHYQSSSSKKLKKRVVRNLDLFPKIEKDLTVKSSSGSKLTTIAYILTVIIIFAEIYAHKTANSQYKEHVTVDKSLGKKMRVDLNITFPGLHCDDVHMDIMDVAGDAHTDVEDTIVKKRLHKDGSQLSTEEITLDLNKAHAKEKEILDAIDKSLAPDYCGPCYGAGEPGDCCNHCDDVLQKYQDRKWSKTQVKMIAEQCVREGKTTPSRMRKNEGCNIAGFMQFNRVNGNFHIAMGEGVERDGQHIHSFLPDDVGNFNASHIIHELRFGPEYTSGKGSSEPTTLEGVTKIVTEENGVSGMFQYFIKIVPTTYKGKNVVKTISPGYDFSKDPNEIPVLETNRYFTTERFTPLMMDIDDENWELGEKVAKKYQNQKDVEPAQIQHDDALDDYYNFYYERQEPDRIAGAKVGGNTGTSHHQHESHRQQQAILPGIFFIYQIYPFEVEISMDQVPLTHLFIRILSTVGGVFTIVGMIDALLHSRNGKGSRK
mmetsp:Transcript_8224/g.12385  ORF Transcript_8224/g.12385 Transcript_8224/m.12385 type:complete len:518 (-) Transcript_8224:70-1623(-)|eukprot:CAMPEP_0203675098 /NCGR_PEP_ID=MMETSP0090-20130426/18801_1 /ASSEMBLY_ACC=CAM_ASM_001088 /TAXON_ID=426623 /ORGANISM="Chaetoceros affinis, Strain CCMP159" /LENGTH=517 /DNA_ID=CAMNT_0050541173 /DNA_START=206 /DNA_END=1759 /DNA_ORIENTATION=+